MRIDRAGPLAGLVVLASALASPSTTARVADGPESPPVEMAPAARDFWNSPLVGRVGRRLVEHLEGWPERSPSGSPCSSTSSRAASSGRPTAGSARPSRRPARLGRGPGSSYDRDGDGRVARAEFPGSDADFDRLDRDRDGSLTAADFDFSAHALAPSPARAFSGGTDRDGNGKVTREEFAGLFDAIEPRRLGNSSL